MATTLEQFARECHDILKQDPGPAGRRRICARLETALLNASFIESCLNDKTPERHILYEDPELGFCILAHAYHGAKDTPGKARPVRTYQLTPGMAWLYNEGDLHSPRRRAPTQLIRIEGTNMDRIKRLRYETDINLRGEQ
jgi:hypothetical protein